jgi:hypothetical protein
VKLLAWNIQHGGLTRMARIVEEISAYDPDVFAVTEFRARPGEALCAAMKERGLPHVETNARGREPEWNRGLLAHADGPYERPCPAPSAGLVRWLDIDLPEYGFGIGVLHVMAAGSSKKHPTNVAKTRFWEVVLQAAESWWQEPFLFVGDWNTGAHRVPTTVQAVDVVVSMPKIKTHHWAGVTLSLKNSFGILPGSIYGWPKNVLHWQGIDNSIIELAVSVPIHFVIADGIEAMEGNGPLHGPVRRLGCLVFADDPVAADATCCRLMGIDPTRVRHIQMASSLGNLDTNQIEQRGESVGSVAQQFELMPQFAQLRA